MPTTIDLMAQCLASHTYCSVVLTVHCISAPSPPQLDTSLSIEIVRQWPGASESSGQHINTLLKCLSTRRNRLTSAMPFTWKYNTNLSTYASQLSSSMKGPIVPIKPAMLPNWRTTAGAGLSLSCHLRTRQVNGLTFRRCLTAGRSTKVRRISLLSRGLFLSLASHLPFHYLVSGSRPRRHFMWYISSLAYDNLQSRE